VVWEPGSSTAVSLGTLSGDDRSEAYDISNNNWIVGFSRYSTGSTSRFHAVLWLPVGQYPDGFQAGINDLRGLIAALAGPLWDMESSFATNVNDSGLIAGQAKYTNTATGQTYPRTFLLDLGYLLPGSGKSGPSFAPCQELPASGTYRSSGVRGINSVGQMAGWFNTTGSSSSPSLWDARITTSAGEAAGAYLMPLLNEGEAKGLNNPVYDSVTGALVRATQIVGYYVDASGYNTAALWQDTDNSGTYDSGETFTLPHLGGVGKNGPVSYAYGINDQSQIVGRSLSSSTGTGRACLWQSGTPYDLNSLSDAGSLGLTLDTAAGSTTPGTAPARPRPRSSGRGSKTTNKTTTRYGFVLTPR
jgi:hypothetical protein